MKTLFRSVFSVSALCVLCGLVRLSAADLTLADGRVLREAKITGQSATTVTVRHAGGLASVPKAALPAELQAQYPEVIGQKSKVGSQESEAARAERIAKAKDDEAARVARAKAERAKRAQWLRDNPQDHTVTYRVVTTTPSTKVIATTPEAGRKTFVPVVDSFGVWETTFTAKDGTRLQLGLEELGTDERTALYASNVTVSILVDHAEVRREVLAPRSGTLELAWVLGEADVDQPAVYRSAEKNPDAATAIVDSGGQPQNRVHVTKGSATVRTISQSAGWKED